MSKHPKASAGQSVPSSESHLSSALSVLSTPITSLSSRLFLIFMGWRLRESTVSEEKDSFGVTGVVGVQLVSLNGSNNHCGKTETS